MSSWKTLWNKARNSGFSYQRCLHLCGQDLQLTPVGLCIFIHHLGAGQLGWSPRSFLICPFCDCSGPLHCYVQLTLIVKSVGRRGGEKRQAKGIKLDALLRVGPGFCTACVHLSSPCLGLLTEMLLPGFSGDRFLLLSFPSYHFNIKDTQTRRSDSPIKWEKGHLKVAFLWSQVEKQCQCWSNILHGHGTLGSVCMTSDCICWALQPVVFSTSMLRLFRINWGMVRWRAESLIFCRKACSQSDARAHPHPPHPPHTKEKWTCLK